MKALNFGAAIDRDIMLPVQIDGKAITAAPSPITGMIILTGTANATEKKLAGIAEAYGDALGETMINLLRHREAGRKMSVSVASVKPDAGIARRVYKWPSRRRNMDSIRLRMVENQRAKKSAAETERPLFFPPGSEASDYDKLAANRGFVPSKKGIAATLDVSGMKADRHR
jgi:hypothetical protein